MSVNKLDPSERRILEEVNVQEISKHAETIAQWVRMSGNPEEARAVEYISETLKKAGVDVHRYEFEALVSYPESASLRVLSPDEKDMECITHTLTPSTPPQGMEAELVYVGSGMPGDYDGKDVKGKAVLIDGMGMPGHKQLAEEKGTVAQVFIHGDHLHEICLSPVWGTPTPETAPLLWKTPAICIKGGDGAHLKSLLGQKPVHLLIKARVWTGWKKLPLLIGEVRGKSDEFVLFSGHEDSWYYGATDNAGSNGAMIEVARVMARHRNKMKRGLRVAFWSGHSHGRYPGSTWYADHFWEDINRNCIAHLNTDLIGFKGGNDLTGASTMAEATEFTASVIRELTGQSPGYRRTGRMGDQSFCGCGVPAVLSGLSELEWDKSKPSQPWDWWGWWWHTPDDTIDKLDKDNLLRDTKVYLLAIARLCMLPVLPFDYSATADELVEALTGWQKKAGDKFDLGNCLEKAKELKAEAILLKDMIQNLTARQARKLEIANRTLVRLGRLLIPINYTQVGPFDHDIAMTLPPIPVLQPVARLASCAPDSDDFRFVYTLLVREANKVFHTLDEAVRVIKEACGQLER